jgi:hypothetical protein
MKTPPLLRALIRFLCYMALGTLVATALVFLAYWINPSLGEAAGKWALLIALVTAFQRLVQNQNRRMKTNPRFRRRQLGTTTGTVRMEKSAGPN